MRKAPRISSTRMPLLLLTSSHIGIRRYFPAWIDSDDGASAVELGVSIVLPRLRAALPLRPVRVAAKAHAFKRLSTDARLR